MPRPAGTRLLLAVAVTAAFGVIAALLFKPSVADETSTIVTTAGRVLRIETIASDLDTPWDMAWGPDGAMWVTERAGHVSRSDMTTRTVTRAGDVPDVFESGEAGLMGMAFHPQFEREPWIYFAHSIRAGGGVRNRLVRLRYDNGTLGRAETLIDDIPGARNHDGSRLAFGPDGFLYMTTGDAAEAERAQIRSNLAGKILRLTPRGRPAPDNPFGTEIWSWGHRNPQGLAFHPATNALYSAEHGPGTSDEVNRIERGANYGWPDVRGACDADSERSFCQRNSMIEPVTEFTPTIGVAGAAFYNGDAIPEWKGSLFVTALRGATLVRIALTQDGARAASVERLFESEFGRIRAVLAGPDGALYIATSNRDGRGRPASSDDRILRIRP